jgi:hypothetical protein
VFIQCPRKLLRKLENPWSGIPTRILGYSLQRAHFPHLLCPEVRAARHVQVCKSRGHERLDFYYYDPSSSRYNRHVVIPFCNLGAFLWGVVGPTKVLHMSRYYCIYRENLYSYLLVENDTLARIGTSCLQQLLQNNAQKLSPQLWQRVIATFIWLFKTTTPYQLLDERLRAEVDESSENTSPSDQGMPGSLNKSFS